MRVAARALAVLILAVAFSHNRRDTHYAAPYHLRPLLNGKVIVLKVDVDRDLDAAFASSFSKGPGHSSCAIS